MKWNGLLKIYCYCSSKPQTGPRRYLICFLVIFRHVALCVYISSFITCHIFWFLWKKVQFARRQNRLKCISNYTRSIGNIVKYCVLALKWKRTGKKRLAKNLSESAANACHDYGAVACCKDGAYFRLGAYSNAVGARLLGGGGAACPPPAIFFKTDALRKTKTASQCTRRSVLIYL